MDPIEFLSNHHEGYQWLLQEASKRKIYKPYVFSNYSIEQWLRYRDSIWSSAQRLSVSTEDQKLRDDDYWTDANGNVWSVEVLDDGTAVTACYEK